MTNLNSTAPAAVDAVLAIMRTVASGYSNASSQVVVIDGDPFESYLADQMLWVLGVTQGQQDARDLGNLRRNEEYLIDCIARSYAGSTDDDPAGPLRSIIRSQAYALMQGVVQGITATPTLGLDPEMEFVQLVQFSDTCGPTTNGGWAVEVAFSIHCRAVLER